MSTEQWQQVSRVLDFILAQKVKEEPGMYSIKERPLKPKNKQKRPKPEPQAEQLRLF